MRILKQQHGMTAIGWLLLLVLIITISLPAIKIVPIYIDSLKISHTLKNIEADLYLKGRKTTPEEVKKMLVTSFKNQDLPEITIDEITITQENNKYNVRVQHQFKEQMWSNLYILLISDESVYMPVLP